MLPASRVYSVTCAWLHSLQVNFTRVAPFGALVLGGMLVGEDDQVTRALVPHGFTPRESLERDGWAASLLVRDHVTP